jgi:hypothetical protein
MFGKLAIIFTILTIFAVMAATAYSFSTMQLQSVDKTCGTLKSFHPYKDTLTIRDTKTGLSVDYKAGDQQFCLYNFNNHTEYWYYGWIAFAFAIAAIVCAIVYATNKPEEEDREAKPNGSTL